MRFLFKSVLALMAISNSCSGFQSPAGHCRFAHQSTVSENRLHLGPEHLSDLQSILLDHPSSAFTYLADAAQAVLNAPPGSLQSGGGDEFSGLLDALQGAGDLVRQEESALVTAAQATEAAVENAVEITEETAKDEGWWQAYLNIFKATLLLVHDTIDQPLRNNGITQTWGISIAIFTASIRSLLIPLSVQQSKSAEYIKALKPYMTEIREKFKDNKDMQNRAIGKLYEDANQNPLSGCLVSLVQLPIFLGLYRGVRLLAQEGKLEEPFLWIPSLEGPVSAPDYRGMDWLLSGWHDVNGLLTPQYGWETTLAFLVMPVILVLGQSLTMKVLAPPIDDSMGQEEREQMEKSQVILKFLPLMIGFFSLQVPAGLTIYWFTSNAFTLCQSLAVRAYYKANPPQIELPDYWDALENLENMSPEEKRKAAEAGITVGPKFEDLLEEAMFHVVVDRKPLRNENVAWQRVAESESMTIPTEMKEWVGTTQVHETKKSQEITPAAQVTA